MSRKSTPKAGECGWCCAPLEPTPGNRTERKFCSDAHRAAYKRAERAATTADIVQRLEPYVSEAGTFIYRELVEHLAGKVNEKV